MKFKLESPCFRIVRRKHWRTFTRTNFLDTDHKKTKNPFFEGNIINTKEEESIERNTAVWRRKAQTSTRHFSKHEGKGGRRLTVNVGDLVS